jgi:hypothetical protein
MTQFRFLSAGVRCGASPCFTMHSAASSSQHGDNLGLKQDVTAQLCLHGMAGGSAVFVRKHLDPGRVMVSFCLSHASRFGHVLAT